MSLHDFRRRWPENAAGAFYVGNQCTDCDLCRELVPSVFARNSERGYSFVAKQPESEKEIEATKEAAEACCMATIHADGNDYDGAVITPAPDTDYPKRFWGRLLEKLIFRTGIK